MTLTVKDGSSIVVEVFFSVGAVHATERLLQSIAYKRAAWIQFSFNHRLDVASIF